MDTIEFSDFAKVSLHIGTILTAELNPKARKPAYVMTIDFGDLGIKTTSAQITQNYTADELPGTQVVAVVNFAVKRVAGVKSEVLVLGGVCPEQDVIILSPNKPIANGTKVG